MSRPLPESAIAVLGMAGRFPGAAGVDELWRNLRAGHEAITRLSNEEVRAAGVDPALYHQPTYVKAAAFVADADLFDAGFFGYNPREAEVMDPQHRLFLECAWEALEQAGYDPERFGGAIGVFGGSAFCTYLMRNLYANPRAMQHLGDLQVSVGNERDSLCSTVSYKLGLKGPSVAVQTFCSTSLVAVHLACQSLLSFECDLALAGGVAIQFPQQAGYLYQEGGILSPDGHCRTFDARAQGSIMGNGSAVVALKRLEEAHADRDPIRAVILGSAVNNDGSLRAGYTAPGLDGQAAVITEALAAAGVEPETLGYYEAHGTATSLGDSIELGALLKAFHGRTHRRGFCAVGSVKPNLGHLDRAAGVTGLIKTVLTLENGELPPSLHFERTSPDLDLEASPFFVNTRLSSWNAGAEPRRAGVSSFGLGGTNAHVVLEEAPPLPVTGAARSGQLLVLSARTPTALERMAARLAEHLRSHPRLALADVAHTLAVGRKVFPYRAFVVARDTAEAIERLSSGAVEPVRQDGRGRAVRLAFRDLGDAAATLTDRLAGWGIADAGPAAPGEPLAVELGPEHQELAALLAVAGRLWLAGVEIDWQGFYRGEKRRRVALPTYPFERQRYWVEPDPAAAPAVASASARKPDLADWFYLPAWKPSLRPPRPEPGALAAAGPWLLFLDGQGLGARLADRLRAAGAEVHTVEPGENRSFSTTGTWTIDPRDPADYQALLKRLSGPPRRIVHLWSVTGGPARAGSGHGAAEVSPLRCSAPPSAALPGDAALLGASFAASEAEPAGGAEVEACDGAGPGGRDLVESPWDSFAAAQHLGFTSLLYLARALAKARVKEQIHVWAVADGLFEVQGDETIAPEKATLLGPLTVIPQELPQISCRLLEIAPGAGGEAMADRLLADLARPGADRLVAWRGSRRHVQGFEPVRLEQASAPLRPHGVYWLTGGLGGVGSLLAEHLARTCQARLVLLGRTALPEREGWGAWLASHGESDPVSQRLRRLLALEAAGAEVLPLVADVANESDLRRALAATRERFGALHGVIHAAGSNDERGYRGVEETTTASASLHFDPKIRGVQNLARVLAGQDLDFCLLMSSLSAVLGGLGFAAYTAANAYLDAFARQRHAAGDTAWKSVDWDTWRLRADQHAVVGATVAAFEMAPEEGIEVFDRLLAHDFGPHLVESTGDLGARLAQWVRVEGASAKTKEAASATPRHARPALAAAYRAPESDLERAVAEIWQEVLGLAAVGLDDNFFELGGHSLLATQLFARLRQALDVDLALRSLFEAPTVAELAREIVVRLAAGTAGGDAMPPLVAVDRSGPLPLSFAQQRLWLLHQLEPGSSAYNRPGALRLSGPLAVASLARALATVVARHEALRTRFVLVAEEPAQLIDPPRHLAFPLVDLSGLPAERRDAVARELAAREARQPFDLERGPLLRTGLIRQATDEHLLLFTLHHIVSDGWSEGVLIGEAVAIYEAAERGAGSPLPPLPIQYGDFAVWQRGFMHGEVVARHLAYWREQLAGAPPELRLPTLGQHGRADRSGPPTLAGGREEIQLGRELTDALKRLGRHEEATLYVTLLAAFAVLLAHVSGQDDIVVGTPVAARDTVETEALIGFFANTLVLRTKLDGDPSFRQLLARVAEVSLGAQAHQHLPFEMVVDDLNPERHLDRSPLFQVWFVLQSTTVEPPEVPGLTFAALDLRSAEVRHDLLLDATEKPDGLRLLCEYKVDLFSTETVRRLLARLRLILETAVADPGVPLRVITRELAAADAASERERQAEYASAVAQTFRRAERKAVRLPPPGVSS